MVTHDTIAEVIPKTHGVQPAQSYLSKRVTASRVTTPPPLPPAERHDGSKNGRRWSAAKALPTMLDTADTNIALDTAWFRVKRETST